MAALPSGSRRAVLAQRQPDAVYLPWKGVGKGYSGYVAFDKRQITIA